MRRLRTACLTAALLWATAPASAHHAAADFTVANSTANAYSNTTWFVTWGANLPTSMTLHYPTGWRWAHADDTTSPISPTPLDGDTVGGGTMTARWEPFCSTPPADRAMTVTWEDTPSGGPSGAVAQVTVTVNLLFNSQGYVVRNGSGDYSLVFPDFPDQYICSTTTAGAMALTIYGTVPGTSRRVTQNLGSTGSYTTTVSYTDTAGTLHTANDSVTIT
ncbi:MAG TPA: hypothetical protein VGB03_07100 [Acidimicrobiales bacterium]